MIQSKEKPYVLYVAEIIYSKICEIKKQNLNAIGEAVGILIRTDCENCLIKDNLIDKKDGLNEAESYGIWNAALQKAVIIKNKIVGFSNGITNSSINYEVISNEIICGPQERSIGITLDNGNKYKDLKVIQMANKISSCIYSNFTCINAKLGECRYWDSKVFKYQLYPLDIELFIVA